MTREPATLAALDLVRVPASLREPEASCTKTHRAAGQTGGSTQRSGDRSDDADVLRLVALAALGHVELDALTLFQRTVTVALDGAEVHEDVGATIARDEPIPLLIVEPLDGAGSQDRAILSVSAGRF